MLLEMSIDIGPLEERGAAALDVRDDAAAAPVIDGAEGFVETPGEFVPGDEAFVRGAGGAKVTNGRQRLGRLDPVRGGCGLVCYVRLVVHSLFCLPLCFCQFSIS